MNKKALTEADIRTKFITPALVGPKGGKWNVMTQVREEVYFTKGRAIVRGQTVKRGEAQKADDILSYKPNLPLAVIEAKDNDHSVGAGMQQALAYAEILDVPFAYSSNGDAFLEHDRTVKGGPVTREIPLDQFPTPDELWSRYGAAKGWRPEDGQLDKHGLVIEDRAYNDRDYDRNLILEKRTAAVAARVTEFLRATNRFAKTIVFCENIDHAERMRQALVNANADLAAANAKYVIRITGDNDEGKAQLDNFIAPRRSIRSSPVPHSSGQVACGQKGGHR